jgi:hypothetical protein
MKAAEREAAQRIDDAAHAKAKQMVEQAEIDRRAKQIAARYGVRS